MKLVYRSNSEAYQDIERKFDEIEGGSRFAAHVDGRRSDGTRTYNQVDGEGDIKDHPSMTLSYELISIRMVHTGDSRQQITYYPLNDVVHHCELSPENLLIFAKCLDHYLAAYQKERVKADLTAESVIDRIASWTN